MKLFGIGLPAKVIIMILILKGSGRLKNKSLNFQLFFCSISFPNFFPRQILFWYNLNCHSFVCLLKFCRLSCCIAKFACTIFFVVGGASVQCSFRGDLKNFDEIFFFVVSTCVYSMAVGLIVLSRIFFAVSNFH